MKIFFKNNCFFKNAVRQNLFHLFIIIMIFLLGNKNQLLAESPIVLKLTTGNSHNFPLLIGNGTKFNWEKPGVTIELLQLVDEEIPQIKLNYYRTNWRRCLDQLKKNERQGAFTSSFKKGRLKYGVYPMKNGKADPKRRITINSYAFYKMLGSSVQWDGKKFTNLKGRIGAILGYSSVGELKKRGFLVDDGATTSINNLNKLLARRFYVITDHPKKIDFTIKNNHKYKNIVKLEPPFVMKPYYLMFSHQFIKKHPDLANKIWDKMAKIRESKIMQKIHDKYYALPDKLIKK